MKPGELIVIVDAVEDAVKFYTEKLAFSIVGLAVDKEDKSRLGYVQLRKGKCFITFRTPRIEELAEFSFIKRCVGRSVYLYVDMKTGIEKYHDRCDKKGVKISSPLKESSCCPGKQSFTLRDPFGVKLIFSQPIEGFVPKYSYDFFGLSIDKSSLKDQDHAEKELLDKMIATLKTFGVLRRAAKKYAKLWIKERVKSQ